MFFNLCSQISTSDVEIHVITNIPRSSDVIHRKGFIIHGFETRQGVEPLKSISYFRFLLKAGRHFLALQRSLGVDIVQMLSSSPLLGLYLALLAKTGGCKSVMGLIGSLTGREELNRPKQTLMGSPILFRIVYRVASRLPGWLWFRWLDEIVVVSQNTASFLREIGVDEKQIFLIPPGIDLQVFQPRNGPNPPPFQIVYASSCYPWKGVFDLLEAFKMVLDQGFPVELLYSFYDKRSDSKTIGAFISDIEQRIETMGLKNRVAIRDGPVNNMEEVIASAHIVVCPIKTVIGTVDVPMSVLEAMACGVPVVGTRVGGVPDAVVDGANGYLVEPSSPKQLARAIIQMLEDPSEMNRMGKEGHRLAKRFDVHLSASLLRQAYLTLVKGAAPAVARR